MGVILINSFQVCLESLPNFHGKNLEAFRIIFVAKIQQCFVSDASQHTKCYSHQAFEVRIWQWGFPIFTAKIRQSFMFGVLWCTDRVLRLCIRCVSTCSYCDDPKPFKAASMLMRAHGSRPSQSGSINFVVLPLVSTLSYSTSFIPTLLFETIRSLSLCRETGSSRLGYCVLLLQLWFYSHLSVISKVQPTRFLRKNRVKITVALDLPFTGNTTTWLGYLFDLGPFDWV